MCHIDMESKKKNDNDKYFKKRERANTGRLRVR